MEGKQALVAETINKINVCNNAKQKVSLRAAHRVAASAAGLLTADSLHQNSFFVCCPAGAAPRAAGGAAAQE